jgi:hypothetical protein
VLKISLFGAFSAEINGEPIKKPSRKRALKLLAVLALGQERYQNHTNLRAILSADKDVSLNSLSQDLISLRGALGQPLSRAVKQDILRPYLQETQGGLRLHPENVWVDYWDFIEMIRVGEWDDALQTSQRKLLDGWEDAWLDDHYSNIAASRERATRYIEQGVLRQASPLPLHNLHKYASRRARDLGNAVRLIGRDIAGGVKLVQSHRSANIMGVGGVGKTGFALETAHQLQPQYEGTFFVPLEAIQEADKAWTEIASAISLRLSPYDSPDITVCKTLETKHTLLILDNCEQLLPGIEQITLNLLGACPRLRIITTCRTPLEKIQQNYALEPLLENQSNQMLRGELQQGGSSDTMSSQVLESATALFRLHEGIPLFIEITARLLTRFSVEDLLKIETAHVLALNKRDKRL